MAQQKEKPVPQLIIDNYLVRKGKLVVDYRIKKGTEEKGDGESEKGEIDESTSLSEEAEFEQFAKSVLEELANQKTAKPERVDKRELSRRAMGTLRSKTGRYIIYGLLSIGGGAFLGHKLYKHFKPEAITIPTTPPDEGQEIPTTQTDEQRPKPAPRPGEREKPGEKAEDLAPDLLREREAKISFWLENILQIERGFSLVPGYKIPSVTRGVYESLLLALLGKASDSAEQQRVKNLSDADLIRSVKTAVISGIDNSNVDNINIK